MAEDESPGEFDGWRSENIGAAYHDAALGRGFEVDRSVAHAGGHQQLQFVEPLEERPPERRAFPHGYDDLEVAKPPGQGVLIAERVMKCLHGDAGAEAIPLGQPQRHVLIIVENGQSRHRCPGLREEPSACFTGCCASQDAALKKYCERRRRRRAPLRLESLPLACWRRRPPRWRSLPAFRSASATRSDGPK